ncbi:DEKNAAC105552 [Brettanomyces naardenensis]|uniref:DEKNAAC105552 n=1 Tax=Brettanomyces naardenensis TaxID=13370 RepID=A0A448YTX3_BRENA|nr:DEKNAAC105552 [Brettanomyces naardenensis]
MSDPRIPSQYKELLKQAFQNGSVPSDNSRRLKRRRKNRSRSPDNGSPSSPGITKEGSASSEEVTEVTRKMYVGSSNSFKLKYIPKVNSREIKEGSSNDAAIVLSSDEDVADFRRNSTKVEGDHNDGEVEVNEDDEDEDDYSDEDDFNAEDFEDVDLEHVPTALPSLHDYEDDDKQISIPLQNTKQANRPKKKKTVVTKEERDFRRTFHMLYIFTMIAHGVCRNAWCSDRDLLESLKGDIPTKIIKEYTDYLSHRQRTDVSTQSKTRKLLDLLKHLMIYWYKSWTVDNYAPVIYKKGWNELNTPAHYQRIGKQEFRTALEQRSGSRDIAAQGFVGLLRSIGLQARMVFSLQPPDFTNLSQLSALAEKHDATERKKIVQQTQSLQKKRGRVLTQHDRLLNSLRVHRPTYTNMRPSDYDDVESKYGNFPVFWCEVWDKDAKHFITIDPIVKKTIEVVRTKSQLEPPNSEIRNNAFYVIGYDRLGGVKDITRRYAEAFNAKVRKKRITREPRGEAWYDAVLRGATTVNRLKLNKIDKFEELEFEEFSLREGMPNSIQDFKNHPVYVIEDQLKANEVLKPKISCGTIRKKNKFNKQGVLIPVYKRKNVRIVRSAKAWYMRGRVLKMGERALKMRVKPKVKKKTVDEDDFQVSEDGDNEDEDVGLYADFQTELFIPPPIVNGEIPKNAFGNIDVYQPWMVPEGCVHIPKDHAEKAARIMGIEYAPAAVGFNFEGDRRSRSVNATVKINGIVTFEEYKDAVELVSQGLEEWEEEKDRRRAELVALRAWKVLLLRLRIVNRLNEEHGEVSEDDVDVDDEYVPSDDSDKFEAEAGGFLLGDVKNVDEDMYFGGAEDELAEMEVSDFQQSTPQNEEAEAASVESEKESLPGEQSTRLNEGLQESGDIDEFGEFMKEAGLEGDEEGENREAGYDTVGNLAAGVVEEETTPTEGSDDRGSSEDESPGGFIMQNDMTETNSYAMNTDGETNLSEERPLSATDDVTLINAAVLKDEEKDLSLTGASSAAPLPATGSITHPAVSIVGNADEDDLVYMGEETGASTSADDDIQITQEIKKPDQHSSVGNPVSPIEVASDSSVIDLDAEYDDDEGYEFEYSDSM